MPKANSITIVFTSFPINSFHISRSAHIKIISDPDIHFMVIFFKAVNVPVLTAYDIAQN